jgi:hypothetical protein
MEGQRMNTRGEHRRTQDQLQPIPGASVIGCGFNILGTYSTRSLMSQIISLGNAGSSTYEYAGITYSVPQNASPVDCGAVAFGSLGELAKAGESRG